MTAQYVVVQSSADGTSVPVNSEEQVDAALAAMARCGQDVADIYFGDPADPDSYASGQRLVVVPKSPGRLRPLRDGSGETVADVARKALGLV